MTGGLSHLPGSFSGGHQDHSAGEAPAPEGSTHRLIRENGLDGTVNHDSGFLARRTAYSKPSLLAKRVY